MSARGLRAILDLPCPLRTLFFCRGCSLHRKRITCLGLSLMSAQPSSHRSTTSSAHPPRATTSVTTFLFAPRTKAKKTRKCAAVKRMINPNDARLKNKSSTTSKLSASSSSSSPSSTRPSPSSSSSDVSLVRHVPRPSTSLFFRYNTALGPPYQLLLDTNFINFSIQNKLDIVTSAMDCLLAKVTPLITDCVMGELERLGAKYRVALRVAKDERFGRLRCGHKGVYADDCLVRRVEAHKCYIVATCDRDLKRRLRKVPGVPIMYITKHQFSIERFADVNAAPRE